MHMYSLCLVLCHTDTCHDMQPLLGSVSYWHLPRYALLAWFCVCRIFPRDAFMTSVLASNSPTILGLANDSHQTRRRLEFRCLSMILTWHNDYFVLRLAGSLQMILQIFGCWQFSRDESYFYLMRSVELVWRHEVLHFFTCCDELVFSLPTNVSLELDFVQNINNEAIAAVDNHWNLQQSNHDVDCVICPVTALSAINTPLGRLANVLTQNYILQVSSRVRDMVNLWLEFAAELGSCRRSDFIILR